MTQTFVDRCRERHLARGWSGVGPTLLSAMADVLRRAPGEWRDAALRERTDARRPSGLRLESVGQDVRIAVRSMRRSPGFTIIVTVTLALGIGANTATFSLVNGVLLSPLPYDHADRIVTVAEVNPQIDIEPRWASIPNYVDWKDQARTFDEMALYRGRSRAITGGGAPLYVYSAMITEDFFDVFGVTPLIGRGIRADETGPGGGAVVVLGHGLWQRRYGADSTVVGRTVFVDGVGYTVVGIMPSGFTEPGPWIAPGLVVDLWLPFPVDANEDGRNNRSYHVAGRLRPNIGMTEARTEMAVLDERLSRAFPAANEHWDTVVVSWRDMLVGGLDNTLWLLWGAVGLVLFIACANVANLKLNRMLARRAEMAVRAALGAGGGRIVRQVLTESLLLAVVGGTVGLLIAVGVVNLILHLNPGTVPLVDQIGVDGRVLTITAGLTLLTALGFGLLPALYAARPNLATEIKEGVTGVGGGHFRVRHVMAVVQLGLAFTLLAGAGLLGRSFVRLTAVSPGLNPGNVLAATVALSWNRVSTIEARAGFVSGVLERLGGLPGVISVGMINSLPFTDSNSFMPIWVEGQPEPEPGRAHVVPFRGISPEYFATLEIPLLAGRTFDTGDLANPTTAIVNRRMAELYWPGESPLEQRFRIYGEDEFLTVVGVVGEVRHYGLDADVMPEVYQPYTTEFLTSKTFVLRTAGDPASLAPVVERAILEVDPDQPLRDIETMEALVRRSVAHPRFNTAMLGVAALVALVLATIGLFGVVSYMVTARTREIGIRMALGARRSGVVRTVLGRGATLAAWGIAGGLLVSLLIGRVITNLLYGTPPYDPMVYVALVVVFLGITLLASYLPARRASRIDPIYTLRE